MACAGSLVTRPPGREPLPRVNPSNSQVVKQGPSPNTGVDWAQSPPPKGPPRGVIDSIFPLLSRQTRSGVKQQVSPSQGTRNVPDPPSGNVTNHSLKQPAEEIRQLFAHSPLSGSSKIRGSSIISASNAASNTSCSVHPPQPETNSTSVICMSSNAPQARLVTKVTSIAQPKHS